MNERHTSPTKTMDANTTGAKRKQKRPEESAQRWAPELLMGEGGEREEFRLF